MYFGNAFKVFENTAHGIIIVFTGVYKHTFKFSTRQVSRPCINALKVRLWEFLNVVYSEGCITR